MTVNNDFRSEPTPAYEIFGNLENLILSDPDEDEEFFMPALEGACHLKLCKPANQMCCNFRYLSPGHRFPVRPFLVSIRVSALTLFSSAAFAFSIKTIPQSRLAKISHSIHSQASSWLSALFFSDSQATFLPTNVDCLAKTLRLALANKFDNYLSEGYFGIKPVAIFINSNNPYLPELKLAAHSISLPQQCIKVISCTSGFLEIAELEKQIEDDKSLTPLMLLADFGSSLNGDVDGSLQALSAISEKHNLWLHITGSQIASFALDQNQSETTKRVNSMSLELENWLGLPTITMALLYKPFAALNQSVFEIESEMRKIDLFPLWVVLQNIGRERVLHIIDQAFHSCKIMHELVSRIKGFKMLSNGPISDGDKSSAYATAVLFQFDGSNVVETTPDANLPAKSGGKDLNALYYSRLNSWLYQTLETDFPQVQLTLLEHPVYGTCIRYCPFELSMGEKVNF